MQFFVHHFSFICVDGMPGPLLEFYFAFLFIISCLDFILCLDFLSCQDRSLDSISTTIEFASFSYLSELSLDACLLSKIIKPKMYNAHKMSAKISQLNPVQRLVVRYAFENQIDLATFKFAQLLDSGPIFNNKSEYNATLRLYCNYRRNIHLLWYNTICTVFGSVIVCIKMIFYSTWK